MIRSKMFPLFLAIFVLLLALPSFGAEKYSNEVLNSVKGKAARIGAFLGTNNMFGLSLYWSELYWSGLDNWAPHGSIYYGSIYYRKGDSPDDYIIASDVAYKIYNNQVEYNKFNIYRGIGLGYANVQNPNYGRFTGTYVSDAKYDYFYIAGYLGAIYWVDTSWKKVLDYFIELQPIIGRDGLILLLKLGVGM